MLSIIPLVIITVMGFFQKVDDLAHAVVKADPKYLQVDKMMPHTMAAASVETDDISAELLLSIVYSESRYTPEATSYVYRGKRIANVPKWARDTKPPKGVTGPYFCGVTQVAAKMSWQRCQELRDLNTAYQVAVTELTAWWKACGKYKMDRLRCTLFGYGGGFPAIKRRTSTYPSRVLDRARRIHNGVLKRQDGRQPKDV